MNIKEKEIEAVSFSNGVGGLLQKERKARKLTIKEISQETAISPRYLMALENDDYSQFPGETYAIGFLSNYAEYLNLDRARLISLFKQQQIDTSPSPLEELTKRGTIINFFRLILTGGGGNFQLVVSILAIILIGGLIYNFVNFKAIKLNFFSMSADSPFCSGERELRVSSLPIIGATPRNETLSLSPPDAIRISTDGMILLFCLEKVKTKGQTKPIGVFNVRVDGKENYSFEVMEGRSYTLNNEQKEFSKISKNIVFTPTVLNNFSARIELETKDHLAKEISKELNPTNIENKQNPELNEKNEITQNTQNKDNTQVDQTVEVAKNKDLINESENKKEVTNEKLANSNTTDNTVSNKQNAIQTDIQITLEFIKDSYVEWTKDGQYFRGRLMTSGETHTFEAQNRLDIKIGNGGGVRIRREGALLV